MIRAFVVSALVLTATAGSARADELYPPRDRLGPPLSWRWKRFGAADYAVTGGGGALILALAIIKPRAQHSLSGGILFDEAARDALRARTIDTRYAFRDAADVGFSLAVTWPFLADSLTTAWWYRGSRDVAQEMALIDLEALAIAGAVQGITNVMVSRERPYGRTCGSDELPENSVDCRGSGHYRSFFSGHTTFSFTGAALICAHHFKNSLLGAPWDALSCAGAYAVASTTAAFRIVGDDHYASDVMVGALVGSAIGYGVPLLHYRDPDANARNNSLQLTVVPTGTSLNLMGTF